MALSQDEAENQRAGARGEAFGYSCQRCMRCCYNQVVHVTPYESARLARHLGVTTTEFRKRWTQDAAGTSLARRENGACVFLGQEGCSVHPERPLVCRIYPLGRILDADGSERWKHVVPHPETEGIYSKNGTIADFIAAQGALPFMEATEEYAAWLDRAVTLLQDRAQQATGTPDTNDLLDIDRTIDEHCRASGEKEPVDIEARKTLHLKLLHQVLDAFEEETS